MTANSDLRPCRGRDDFFSFIFGLRCDFVRVPLQECRSIRSGASGLPYYCAPLVCVSDVIDLLAVW